ncbi:hypothetical protein [Vreelandella alkaliphila]|uniref:Uncharacterized protein n=1 Tax=Vreelandella alkaliphila TaxID=272774 RepID=A0AAJ2VQK1_9GAMM|nr:hypothetical protein [Halomonas alkaliphila]MDX5979632.1 hypothetical protein [Halomonas alkaliphila]
MNIVLTVHPGKPDAFTVALVSDGPEGVASIGADDDGFIGAIAAACSYLSGLDGKTVTFGSNATVADLAIVIGKYHNGDIEVTAGRLPPALLDDPMTDDEQQSDNQ